MTIQTCLKLHASISLTANRKNTLLNRNENFYFPYSLFVNSVSFLLNNRQWNKLLSSLKGLLSFLNDFECFLPFLNIHVDEHILKTDQNGIVNITGKAAVTMATLNVFDISLSILCCYSNETLDSDTISKFY